MTNEERYLRARYGEIIRQQDSELKALRTQVESVDSYLVWSNEHRAWWRPKSCGYTVHLDRAGRYTRAEAINIASRARHGWSPGEPPPEIAISERDALECAGPLPRQERTDE